MLRFVSLLLLSLAILFASGCGRKKYENPIAKDTDQPDKVLYDKAIADIEKGRYEVARLTLNTLINTYDTSEYLAKAKLAIADSWFREGGSHGMAQAEAEYKDFILFYPTMEEAAESQEKICMIHYRQMDKVDRDPKHAYRAEDECRQMLVQFPNSQFAPRAQQLLRNIQEVLAESEHRVGEYYWKKGSFPAAANREEAVSNQYPLYSHSDDALWTLGESYSKMGARYREKAAAAYAKIVSHYPLSPRAEEAKEKLRVMEMPIPEPDPVAVARMRYEIENSTKAGFMQKSTGFIKRGPDMTTAAKSGTPTMTPMKRSIPASIPAAAAASSGAAAGASGVTDVTVSTVGANSDLDTKPDARANPPASSADAEATAAPVATPAEPLPSNRPAPPAKQKKQKKEKEKKE